MRYGSTSQLPDEVRHHLEGHAQGAWRETYNRIVHRRRTLSDEKAKRHARRIAWATTPAGGHTEHVENAETREGAERDKVPEEGKRLEQLMNREQAALSRELRQIAIDYRKDFKSTIRDDDAVTANLLERKLKELRRRYRPRLKSAIGERIARVRKRVQEITPEENPELADLVDVSRLPNPDVKQNVAFEQSLQILVDDLAQEVLNRAESAAVDSYRETERQRDQDGDQQRLDIDRPADATLEGVAKETGSASVQEGRDDVAQEAQDQAEETIYAVRTSVLDSNTCQPCRDLHGRRFEVGSKAYNLYAPPAECKGREKCRCYYKLERGRVESRAFQWGQAIELAASETDGEADGWYLLFSWGEKDHPNGPFTVDREWAHGLVRSFRYMERVHGDYPTILRQHKEDGFVYGDVTGMRVADEGVEVHLSWKPFAKPLVQQGAIDRLSGTFIDEWTDPETGEVLGPILYEASFVSREHLKSLPTITEQRKRPNDSAIPPSYRRMEAHVDPDEDDEQTTESAETAPEDGQADETENDGDPESPPIEADDGEGAEEGEQTGNQPDASVNFTRWLDGVIQESSSPPDRPGTGRQDHLETITDGTEMGVEELDEMLKNGKLAYPPDALLNSVAAWLDVEAQKLRAGNLGAVGADEPETGGEEVGNSEGGTNDDTPTANAGQPDDQTRRQLEAYREKLTKYECKDAGLDDQTADRLAKIRKRDERAYELAIGALKEASTENEDPIDEEHGTTGAAPTGGGLRQLCRQAKEDGVKRGPPLLDYIENRGFEMEVYDAEVAREVYEEEQ